MNKAILAIAAAVVSVVLITLAPQIFELCYYEREFSNEMYNEGLYPVAALTIVTVAWTVAALFYYAINSVSFSRWYHWLVMLAVAAVIAPVAIYSYSSAIFSEIGYDFSAQLSFFSFYSAVITSVMFVVVSFGIRWWSSNCRHTPIPE